MLNKFKFNLQFHSGEGGGGSGGFDGSASSDAQNATATDTTPTEPQSIRSVTSSLMSAYGSGSMDDGTADAQTADPVADVNPIDDPVFSMGDGLQTAPPSQPAPAFDISAMIAEIKALSAQVGSMNTPKQQEAVQETKQEIQTKYGLQLDEVEKITSGLQDKLYDNPQAFTDDIMKLVESQVNQRMGPINGLMENLHFQKAMTDFGNAHPDLGTYEGEMVKVIEEFRTNKALGIDVEAQKNNPAFHEMVYNMAKGKMAQAPKTIDDFLSDEESLAKILGTDTVKAAYLKNLEQEIQSKRPPTMPGKVSAGSPITPPTKHTTISGVTKHLQNAHK